MRIAILDPALGNSGAHNAGFAASLGRRTDTAHEAGIYCHQSLPDALRRELEAAGVQVGTPFSIRFYELFGQGGSPAEHGDWIARLAAEYRLALEQVLSRWGKGPVLLIHHTLSWEHALALAQAIAALGPAAHRLHHMALLMYSPGLDAQGLPWDATLRSNFAEAFGLLARQPNVHLYASCSEYAGAYAVLLGLARPIPLHPCFLGDWSASPSRHADPNTHLLYLGVVKEDKGFFDLHERLPSLLQNSPAEERFIVQFFGPGGKLSPKARAAADKLAKLAKKHTQIVLHEGFWSDEELLAALARAKSLHLPYDANAYRHKTSGLLWLAAWHRIEAVVPAGSWLEREAQRLGMAYTTKENGRIALPPAADCDNAYFRSLFSPFWPWVEAQWHHLSAQ